MMSLSNTTGHAVRALVCLADCATPPASIKDVASSAGVPQPYLAKVVKKLNDAGIIESKRGKSGGIWLARPAKMISLLDICTALEGEDFLGPCLLGSEYCSGGRGCPTHAFWKRHKQLIRKELERTTLSDVLKFNKEQGAKQMSCSRN
jgi:Rrf2 family protein